MKLYNIFFIALFSAMTLTSCETDKELTVVEIPVTPYQIDNLWMVGDATSAEWNIDAPVEMEKIGDNTFQFVGQLKEGEFKCPLETGNWGGAFIMPVNNGTVINSAGVESDEISLMPDGNPDNKWHVTESGTYKVVIDGNKHKVSVSFQK